VLELTARQAKALEHVRTNSPKVTALASAFQAAGHELYLVGGSVRDALLGRLGNDLDFTTSARPDEIEKLVKPLAKATWDVGRAYGTIAALLVDDPEDAEEGKEEDNQPKEWQVEITTFRADTYTSDSRKPEVIFGDHLAGDLIRRDFTVNAMAVDMYTGKLLDPFRGLDDLELRTIRTPAAPEISFSDDPLRMMRAARFISQLGFLPDVDVVHAMSDMKERIEIVSAERIRTELDKLLLSNNPRLGLNLMVETGLADIVLPELPALKLEIDEHHRHKDVYEHSLLVLEQAIDLEKSRGHQPDLILRIAALLHDIGKPATRQFGPGNKVSFLHHDIVGAKLAKKRMKALKYSNEQIDAVYKLIELHLRFYGYTDAEWTDSAVRRYVRDAGDQLERLHILTRADCTSGNLKKVATLKSAYDQLEWRIEMLNEQEELDAIRPDLNGDQIMQILGIKPGRVVGEAYKFMLEKRIDDGPMDEQKATKVLLQWWEERQSS
jgi:poly(A) polymerase